MFRKLSNIELGRPGIDEYKKIEKSPVVIILDNVRSRHNIGSAFRTCDAFLISKLCLCGISAVPPSPEIHKSALGAEFSVDWEYFKDCREAVRKFKEQGYRIISVEQTENSISIDKYKSGELRIGPDEKYAVIFGNEVSGVSQEVVDMSDMTIEIPQYGTKHSLNVSVAIGIILYTLAGNLPLRDSSNRY